MKRALWLLVVSLAATGKEPQDVYRCGPEGREYQATPCAEGRAVPLDEGPSADQQRKAQAVAQRDAGLLQRLESERQARESQPGAPAIGIGPAAKASAPVALQKKRRKAAAATGDGRAANTPAHTRKPG